MQARLQKRMGSSFSGFRLLTHHWSSTWIAKNVTSSRKPGFKKPRFSQTLTVLYKGEGKAFFCWLTLLPKPDFSCQRDMRNVRLILRGQQSSLGLLQQSGDVFNYFPVKHNQTIYKGRLHPSTMSTTPLKAFQLVQEENHFAFIGPVQVMDHVLIRNKVPDSLAVF